jgi:hypothetical protein
MAAPRYPHGIPAIWKLHVQTLHRELAQIEPKLKDATGDELRRLRARADQIREDITIFQ